MTEFIPIQKWNRINTMHKKVDDNIYIIYIIFITMSQVNVPNGKTSTWPVAKQAGFHN